MPPENHEQASSLLASVNSPSDLRLLPVDRLPELATEVREFLIRQLSDNPGHFASSMGAVDLTIALHYVFNTPDDRIVWDVGHQAYAHKILTGRRDRFSTLRKHGGLSGFPTPDESPYDTFSAGHASNSISAALGMSEAFRHQGLNRNVVAVIGDASISGGMAFEALNNAANNNANLLIILNDNDMSIDRPVGSLNSYLGHITTSKAYNTLRFKTFKALKRMHLLNERQRGLILRFNNSLKSLLQHEQNIFEGLNIRYFGPFDGHDIQRMVRVLQDIKDMKGPRILHLRTVKGKGYEPAEKDPSQWHAPGRFNPLTGERKSGGKTMKFQDVFGEKILQLAQSDPKIVAVTAAMPSGTSVNVMAERFPDRVYDVGISEGHAVTFAGGMAKEGLKPFVAIYSAFLQRAYDGIINDIAIQRLPVVFCIDRAGIVGEDGVTHHGLFDAAYLRPLPGMLVCAPRSAEMLCALMDFAHTYNDGPVAIRYPRGSAPGDEYTVPRPVTIGRGQQLVEGQRAVILSLGTMAGAAVEAAKRVGDVAVFDMVFLKPLDESILCRVAEMKVPVITVEDGTTMGGLGSAVAEWFAENEPSVIVQRLGIDNRFPTHGTPAELYREEHLDADAIVQAVKQLISPVKS